MGISDMSRLRDALGHDNLLMYATCISQHGQPIVYALLCTKKHDMLSNANNPLSFVTAYSRNHFTPEF